MREGREGRAGVVAAHERECGPRAVGLLLHRFGGREREVRERGLQVLERTGELRFVQHDGLGVSGDEFADEAAFEVVRKDRLELGLELRSHRLTVEKLRHGVGEGYGLQAAHDVRACARGNEELKYIIFNYNIMKLFF